MQRRRSILILTLLVALLGVTLLLRSGSLNSLPPGLWWDEASQGLDARDILNGHFRVFFSRAEGKEPLYIYLTTPFVAAWDGQPFAVRAVGAVLGAITVLPIYLAGRALWRKQPAAGLFAGLTAAALWAVNYWPQSINRIGFQVNTFPIVITLTVVTWLNLVHRPTRDRAVAFGFLAGLTLATYLAARFTPLIWLVLYIALPSLKRRALRPTLLWALIGFSVVAVPLAAHFILHPADFAGRSSVFPLIRGDFGKAFLEPLISSTKEVAGVFLGGPGDPNYRHNIPGRPAFSPVLAGLFACGVGAAAYSMRRRDDLRGWTLLTWLLVLSFPSVLSLTSNPHYPRLFGALPAAFLLASWPVAGLFGRLASKGARYQGIVVAVTAGLLAVEAGRTVHDYFITWPRIDLYEAFNGDTLVLGKQIQARPDAVAVVPLYGDATHVLDYAFPRAPILEVQVNEETIAEWLNANLAQAGGKQVMVPVWTIEPQTYADAKQVVPFYLQREGTPISEESYRNFDLLGYTLGLRPAFNATGNPVVLNRSFSDDVRLIEARWGAAYPNQDRNATSASASTSFWVILTWELDRPLTNLRAAVDLVDSNQHRLSHSDEQLLRLEQESPQTWTPATLVRTYHLVEVPGAQLPGPATLEARLYNSETLMPLRPAAGTAQGSVVVANAMIDPPTECVSRDRVQPALPIREFFPMGVSLLGMDEWPQSVQQGASLTLRLYWQADRPLPNEQLFAVSLGDLPVSATLHLPANMPVGCPVYTYADLRLPPDIEPGTYLLALSRIAEEQQPVALGQVVVSGRPRRFEVPALQLPLAATFGDQVSLLGTNTPSPLQVTPGQPITLTLGWQVLDVPTQDLVRFVHLLGPDGKPVAQQDSRPCDGQCPAASWLPGEVLLEEVQLSVPADLAPGRYWLAVGWYDSATLQRLAAADATGHPITENLLILPLDVQIAP